MLLSRNTLPWPRAGKLETHGAGGQHVEAAADHGLEQLEAGRELDQLEVEAAAWPSCPTAGRARSGRRPPACAGSRRCTLVRAWAKAPAAKPASAAAAAPAWRRVLRRRVMVRLLWCRVAIERINRRSCAPACRACASYSCITRSRICARSAAKRGSSCTDSVARVAERHVDHRADARRPRRDDDDARREVDRLFDRVGDQQHRLAFGLRAPAAAGPASRVRVCASRAPNGSSISRNSGCTA